MSGAVLLAQTAVLWFVSSCFCMAEFWLWASFCSGYCSYSVLQHIFCLESSSLTWSARLCERGAVCSRYNGPELGISILCLLQGKQWPVCKYCMMHKELFAKGI